MDRNIFENAPSVDADIFIRIKKDTFSKTSGYVWTRPKLEQKLPGKILCLQYQRNYHKNCRVSFSICSTRFNTLPNSVYRSRVPLAMGDPLQRGSLKTPAKTTENDGMVSSVFI